ncbi:MAG: putative serine/threonine protein kinase [Labilithrix sp.]|nr:putative serine/threonine protein kinase [Labilithrix sp.]
MGFWDFLRSKGEAGAEASRPAPQGTTGRAPAPDAPPASSHAPPRADDLAGRDIAKLARTGLAGGPTESEALYLFAQLRSTPDEARAVEELVRTTQLRALPDPLLLALGSALVDRGELDVAAKAMRGATSSPALVLLGDLAERRGDIPSAIALVERVLLRDLDHPGARERHRRWRSQLGYEVEHKATAPGATVVTREPDAPFDLLREVGRGGAAAVYEAIDRELGRHVALKVYHQPERDKEQLAHEARVAAELEGPAVVRVFDVDPDHGWVALEWAMNGTLREQIRSRDVARLLPIERWATPLARALARVHAHGWVHHDVKPANVLLSRAGAAILTDFGIARRVSEPSPAGSLGYLSPERLAGRPSDPRDDVYGFGRVLEDVLHVVTDEATLARYRPLAAACTGADLGRPADGRALLEHLAAPPRPPPGPRGIGG